MKMIKFILLIITGALINSCNENNPVDSIGTTSEVYSIYGKLNGWDLGSNKNVVFLNAWNSDDVYAASGIDSYGNFILNNLDSPAESMFLNPVYPRISSEANIIRNTLTCTDSTAKKVWGDLIIVLADDTSLTYKGIISRRNFNDPFYFSDESLKHGDFFVEFLYADKDAGLNGIVEYEYSDIYLNIKSHVTREYNLNLKKGWNKQVTLVKFQEVSGDSGFTKINTVRSISNYEPSGGRWYYSYYGD